VRIKKIYVINLADKYHRWYKFKNLDKRFGRFLAIDSRTNPSIYKKKNLSLDPVGLASQLYFSQAPGAIGAYLSHFSIWEDIIKKNTDCAMILEDDANLVSGANHPFYRPMKNSAKLRVLLRRRSPDVEKQTHHSSLLAKTLYRPSGEWVKHNELFTPGRDTIESVVLLE
jgi:GR25 family glycosyltransferase involved in LPS biosynthesis